MARSITAADVAFAQGYVSYDATNPRAFVDQGALGGAIAGETTARTGAISQALAGEAAARASAITASFDAEASARGMAISAAFAANPSGWQTAANVTATLGGYRTTVSADATYAPKATPSFTGGSVQVESASFAGYRTFVSGAPADAKRADIDVNSGAINFRLVNDAYSAATIYMQITRTGYAATGLTLTANAINLAGPVTTQSVTVNGTAIVSDPGTNSLGSLTVSAPNSVSGVNFNLTGNGTVARRKTLRVVNGLFEVINDAYTASILRLTDAGVLSVAQPGVSGNDVPIFSQFAASKAQNGYQRLPSGLIIQWGLALTDANGFVSVTFPIAFPTTIASITGTAGGNVAAGVYSAAQTAASVTFYSRSFGGAVFGSVYVFWQAIGY